MQTISIIGRILGKCTVKEQSGRTTLTFTVRAENSPRDKARSAFDFEVVTSGTANRDKLTPGTGIFVTGLLRIGTSSSFKATVQALAINFLDEVTVSDAEDEMNRIPLQDFGL